MTQVKEYGTMKNGIFRHAKLPVSFGGKIYLSLPPADVRTALGWKNVVDVMPVAPEGYRAQGVRWVEKETTIEREYEMVEIVVPPRKWTPLAIKRGAAAKGWWEPLEQALVAANLQWDFWGAQYIAEDDEAYPAIYAGMVALFGEEAVKEFLDTLPQEV